MDFECQESFGVFFEGICAHQKGLDIDPWLVSCDTWNTAAFLQLGIVNQQSTNHWGWEYGSKYVQMLRESQIFVETSRCFSISELPKVAVLLAFCLAILNPQDQLHEMADELLHVASQAA